MSDIGPAFPLLLNLDINTGWPINAAIFDMPRLTSLRLVLFSLHSWGSIGNLTTLQLSVISIWITSAPTITELCGILGRSPKLRNLHLNYLVPTGPPSPAGHHNVELAHIESFKIQHVGRYIAELLSHLYIPSSAPVFDLCRESIVDPSALDLLPASSTQLQLPFLDIHLNRILSISENAFWFGHSLAKSPFSCQDVKFFEATEFMEDFGSTVDLSRITRINVAIPFAPNVITSTHAWKTFLSHMPLLSQIHLQAPDKELSRFIFDLWSDTKPIHVDSLPSRQNDYP